MKLIKFDLQAAGALKNALSEAERALDRHLGWRGDGAHRAAKGFSGSYSKLFATANTTEAEDRGRLGRVLTETDEGVSLVSRQAEQEEERLTKLAEWRVREFAREQERAEGGLMQPLRLTAMFDPKPSEERIRPTPISATFRARERGRSGGGGSGKRSSADPELLRTFAGQTRGIDSGIEQYLIRIKESWTRFQNSCAWAQIDSATFISGFERYLAENRADADWLDRIADAFEQAGGSVSDTVLDTIAMSKLSPDLESLLQPGLTSEEVAKMFLALGLTAADIEALVPRPGEQPTAAGLSALMALGNLNGLSAEARDIASRAVLLAAGEYPELVYQLMGFKNAGGMSLEAFTEQIAGLQDALDKADDATRKLEGVAGGIAQLVGFGVHEGAVVGAISFGDLDSAANVTVNTPGAISSPKNTADTMVRAAGDLLKQTSRINPGTSFAVVSWIGYHAPQTFPPEVASPERELAGGIRLANFLDGIVDSRGGRALPSVTVLAHSYGSPTAAVALTRTRHQVRSFVSYGSVGFSGGIERDDLNTKNVYAAESARDAKLTGTARVGNTLAGGHRENPVGMEEVTVIATDADPQGGTVAVEGHAMSPDPGTSGEVGYLSANSTSLAEIAKVVAQGKAG